MSEYFEKSFSALGSVFFDGAFASHALNDVLDGSMKKEDKALVTNIFYGVIERNDVLEKKVKEYLTSKPKPKILLTLKIGLYVILYLDKIPLYAACDNAVDFSKNLNAGNYTSLVNAVMRKMCSLRNEETEKDFAFPSWFEDKLKAYYDEKTVKAISSEEKKKTHIRLNEKLISDLVFQSKMKKNGFDFVSSEQGGYFVKDVESVKDLYDKGYITFQSPSSIATCKAFGKGLNGKLLDTCAAPGGKSVYLAEKNKNLFVTSCDVYPHRAELINSYVKRMKTDRIDVKLCDATVFNKDYFESYDYILCDAPCSGTGTFKRKPDVFLNKTEKDVFDLTELQKSILKNVFGYLKSGGVLVYSTCSLLDDENDLVLDFVLKDKSFEVLDRDIGVGSKYIVQKKYGKQILPLDGYDGFYIAVLLKK